MNLFTSKLKRISQGFSFGMVLQFAIGPVSLYVFQTAFNLGFLSSMKALFGVIFVDAIFIACAAFGITAFLQKSRYQVVFQWLSVIVILTYALLMIFGSREKNSLDLSSPFLSAFILTASSPLTILFWAGIFGTKIQTENFSRSDLFYFSSGALLSTLFFLMLVCLLGSLINDTIPLGLIETLNFVIGFTLIIYALKIAVKNLRGKPDMSPDE